MAYKAILLEEIGKDVPEVQELRNKHVTIESAERLFELLDIYCTNRKLQLIQVYNVYGAQTLVITKTKNYECP